MTFHYIEIFEGFVHIFMVAEKQVFMFSLVFIFILLQLLRYKGMILYNVINVIFNLIYSQYIRTYPILLLFLLKTESSAMNVMIISYLFIIVHQCFN